MYQTDVPICLSALTSKCIQYRLRVDGSIYSDYSDSKVEKGGEVFFLRWHPALPTFSCIAIVHRPNTRLKLMILRVAYYKSLLNY